ncbi:hypothetical protein NMG60_11029165 [Bertholletia excelsa]
MPEDDPSDSETRANDSDSSFDELETPMSEYEKQRAKRIEENRARMEALGIKKTASSFAGMMKTRMKKSEAKGKAMVGEEDEEYRPEEGEDELSSSSEEDGEDEDYVSGENSRSRKSKGKKPKKKVSVQKLMNNSDFVDEDEALRRAIALSLQDSAQCSGVRRSLNHGIANEEKGNAHLQESTANRKRKKSLASSRVQMTEDELVMHFFQFDEAGKGAISLRDLRRVAAAHDFTWSDKEMADMIHCFDSDGDGKLSLEDFHKIAGRCNMIQISENS